MEFIKNSMIAKCPHPNTSVSLPDIPKNLSMTTIKGRHEDLSHSDIKIDVGLFREEHPTILKSILELNDSTISTKKGRNYARKGLEKDH